MYLKISALIILTNILLTLVLLWLFKKSSKKTIFVSGIIVLLNLLIFIWLQCIAKEYADYLCCMSGHEISQSIYQTKIKQIGFTALLTGIFLALFLFVQTKMKVKINSAKP